VGQLTGVFAQRLSADARSWSVLALFAGFVGGALDAAFIIATQEDKASLVWPLILLPVLLVPLPVIVPHRTVRVAAAIAMTGWCWLATFSLGPLFIPCLLLMIVAAAKEDV
jgi:hypothetical protein